MDGVAGHQAIPDAQGFSLDQLFKCHLSQLIQDLRMTK